MAKNIYAAALNTQIPSNAEKKATPQSKAIPGREKEMAKNNAGGYSFVMDKWAHLDRFIVMGSEGGNYYTNQTKLTRDNASNVISCIKEDGVRAIDRIVEISDQGRAMKNDPAIFALALAAAIGDQKTVQHAFDNLGKVCRIGTHLFQFMETFNSFGKWRGVAKRGVAKWYARSEDKLAVQLLKYQQRNGWSHRDVLRLAHVKPDTEIKNAMFHWVTKDRAKLDNVMLPAIMIAFEELHASPSVAKAIAGIQEFGLSWEMLPTELLKEKAIWEALLPKMGLTALIRNLGRMSAIGVTAPLSSGEKQIIGRLSNVEDIKNSRVHPIFILNAIKTYSQGRGDKGSLTWSVSRRVVDALNDAFYASFKNIEPTGENYFLAIDCSGSMFGARCMGLDKISAAEAAAVMALATAKAEKNYWIGGFSNDLQPLKISPKMTLEQVLHVMQKFPWAGTDCAQPMLYAKQHKMDVDKFVVYTDNETWAGRVHPIQALKQYRDKYGKGKLIVCGTSVSNFSIADPNDAGMLDVVGFDSATPQLISQF
jgi:60 kDa SS-A/Ro ribonucleoprotein